MANSALWVILLALSGDSCLEYGHITDKGYVYYVEEGSDICESEMEDILNMLTVSELREICCILKKVRIYCHCGIYNLFYCIFHAQLEFSNCWKTIIASYYINSD